MTSNKDKDSSWFKPIGNDDPLPTVATKSEGSYSQMTSRYFKDSKGSASMNRRKVDKRKYKVPRFKKKPS